jgi:phosphoribosyl-AMP cyclohydrolase
MDKLLTIDDLNFGPDGLMSTCIQDAETRDVLILGSANAESLQRTFSTGKVHLWSKSRNELWLKGQSSGDYLAFQEAYINCERTTVVIVAVPVTGRACHKQTHSCFDRPEGGKRTLGP